MAKKLRKRRRKLEGRIIEFDAVKKDKSGYKKPGSMNGRK